ncbi:NB-ARC domain-containing protein [Streptomyces fradiae]|uniref:NB-ARC domain-containing protein n=1 Tax=Streptomyces fradiae TaxID=1906 RepID=UPI00378D89C2
MAVSFIPASRMLERSRLAQEESDTAYFFDLLYLGEMVTKILVVELLTSLEDDRERHRYSLEYELVRADGIGKWAEVLDQAVSGPASQHLNPVGRDSQRALTENFKPETQSWQRKAVDSLNEVCRSLESNYEDLTRQRVSLRAWVRQFSWLRNRTRGHGAPRGAALSSICPMLQDSLTEILENAPAFNRAWVHLHRSLSGKYRISAFGAGRDEFAYLARESDHSLPDGSYIFLGEPRRSALLFTDPDLTDFYLPNGNFRNGKFEALSYISDEVRTIDGSAYLLPKEAQPLSETTASSTMESVGRTLSNVPPRPDRYVQRTMLEGELEELLCDDRHPVVTLQGRGGVGKTSLALEVLHKISQADSFFGIIWFSARDIDLLPEGPKVVRPDVLSIDDVARDFAGLMQVTPPLKTGEARRYLSDNLSGQSEWGPFIFVLDNFETIRDQAELYQFLSNSVRLPNKVLITTRTRDFKADYPIEVGGMNEGEFNELVDVTAARLGIINLVDSEYRDALYRESGGHPYITKVLLGEVAKEGRRITPKRVMAAKDAMLDALFDRSYASLSSAAQRVFLTLCNWRSLVPRIGLEAVLLRPLIGSSGSEIAHLDVDTALRDLEQRSLIEVVRENGDDQEFLSIPLAASEFGKKKLVTSPLKIAIDSDLELIRGFGATTTTDLAHGLGPRVDRLARAAALRAENGEDISQELSVIEYIATGYPSAWLTLAELQRDQLSDLPAAIHSVNRYVENHPEDQEGWNRVVTLYQAADDPLAEMNARLQLAELTRPAFKDLSSAASRLNGLLSRRELVLDADERRLMVRKLRSLLESRYTEADATDLSRLAWLCMYTQDTEAAEHWVTEGLKKDPNNEHCLRLKRRLAADINDY